MATETGTCTTVRHRIRRQFVAAAGTTALAGLGGCAAPTEREPTSPEATVTVRIRNCDPVEHAYEVVACQGGAVTNSFSGTLPPDRSQSVEMVATVRATTDQHEVAIRTDAGQRGRTWDPTECPDFVVDAFVENGAPGFEASCATGE